MVNVQLKKIQVNYPRTTEPALDVPDLNLNTGEILAVVGVSGSGKSTLLRTVAGFIRSKQPHSNSNGATRLSWLEWLISPHSRSPLTGDVLFDGRIVNDLPPRARRIAFATQALNLYPNMTAYENIAFPLRMAHKDKSEQKRRVEMIAKKLHIEPLLQRHPSEISGGEQQRVALGRALVQDANVYLFDEPLSSIDAPLRAAFRKELRLWLREPRRTTFYVTHDIDEAFTIADRIAVLHRGQLLQVATPTDLYKSPNSLMVAKLVWGGRTTVLSGEIDRFNGQPRLRVGSKFIDLDLSKSDVQEESNVWIAAPREAFKLGVGAADELDILSGQVSDIRFAAANYLVDVQGAGFSIEVAANGNNLPAIGNKVTVAVNNNQLRLFPKNSFDENGFITEK